MMWTQLCSLYHKVGTHLTIIVFFQDFPKLQFQLKLDKSNMMFEWESMYWFTLPHQVR